MRTWGPAGLDFHWILPSLAVGGRISASCCDQLSEIHLISHVVDLRQEACDDRAILSRLRIEFLHLPTPDFRAPSTEALKKGVAWSIAAMESGGRVLMHCEHGIGRSALLVLCTLVSLGDSPIAAIRKAKAIRPCISPSPEQLHALVNWSTVSPVSWDDLAAVAYR